MKRSIAWVLVLMVALMPMTSFAQDKPMDDKSDYMSVTGAKFQSGLKDTLLGWTKLFSTPADYNREHKNMFAGVGQGLVDAIAVTVVGAINLITFPIPGEVPPPDGGVDLKG